MKYDLIGIMEKIAKKKPVKVVVCEGCDERCLKATALILKERLCKIILLGDIKEIEKKAKKLKVDIKGAEIVDLKNSGLQDELAGKLVELRKHKGMTAEQAQELIKDENYFGCMYAHCGYADGVAGSAICSTAALMKPALQILREKGKIVSEVSVLNDVKNKRTLFATDFSLNIEPGPEELAQITINAIDSVRSFGIKPKVAVLSFSTKGSGGDGPQVQIVRDTVRIVKEKDPKVLIDGELQFDAAVSKYGCERKCPDSPLKGEANTIIFPNLTASNIFCHGMLQFSDLEFDFTMLKGMAKPVVILGRSTPLNAVKNMIVSCAMQANAAKR